MRRTVPCRRHSTTVSSGSTRTAPVVTSQQRSGSGCGRKRRSSITRRLQQKPGTETEPSVPMPGFILKYCGSWITLSTLKPTEMLYQSTSMTDEWNTWGSWVNSTPPSYFSAIISMLRRPRPLWLGLLETYRPSTFLISS